MIKKSVFSKNYYIDPAVVADIGADICMVMSNANGVIQEASGVINGILSLAASVPAKARCGALLDACATALSGIRNIDFLSYGQRARACMSELCDYSDYANKNLIKNMQMNCEGLQGVIAGGHSLSMLLRYAKTSDGNRLLPTRIGQGVNSTDDDKDKDKKLTLEYQAAKLAGLGVNEEGLPYINNATDAQKYKECLKNLKRGIYTNMEISAAVAGVPINNGIVRINNGTEAKRYMDVMVRLPHKPNTPFYNYTRENIKAITTINHEMDMEVQKFADTYEKNKERYIALSKETNIPPEVIAVIHYRESAPDYFNGTFQVYLHNGEQLGNKTQLVPQDLLFYDFDTAAKDALDRKRSCADKYHVTVESADLVGMMCYLEEYNGAGYYKNGHISPYSYSGTNLYVSGKYVEEENEGGKYNEEVVDHQVGSYLLLNAILEE